MATPDRATEPRDARPALPRLNEVMAALSTAVDIGMGMPIDSGLMVCRAAVRFGEYLGLEADLLQRTYDLALIAHCGCTAENHGLARLVGDEIEMRAHAGWVDWNDPKAMIRFMGGQMSRAFPAYELPVRLLRAMANQRVFKDGSRAICEVAQMLADRMGFDDTFRRDIASGTEFWNGKGFPGACGGRDIPTPARIVLLVQTAMAASHDAGVATALDVVRTRAGTQFDPELAGAFLPRAEELLSEPAGDDLWTQVLRLEPVPSPPLGDERLDACLRAMADFVDLKSPYLVGHSSGVADLAAAAAERAGLPANDALAVRRAGWVHDLGRVGISAAVWGRERPLSFDEWEKVRLHAYHTDRVLARAAYLRDLGGIASMHHERLDGSGYYRSAPAAQQSPAVRILAAADVFHAMTEPRPHRPALAPDQAVRELRAEVRAGRLDGDAAEAVIGAAGQPSRRRREGVAGLTAREIDVLRLLARGLSIKQMARRLVVAPKTVDAHLQHIYGKLGVSTRAAATVFAMQHGLVGPDPVTA
ncbi:MAG TPA: HD domain-containing phosphohydrolase [Actinomycetota bacterium]